MEPKEPKNGPSPYDGMSEEDNADIDRAAAAMVEIITAPEAEQPLAKILNGSNPVKMLAMFLAQAIEKIQVESQKRDVPINPKIWLSTGGALDDISDELADVAEIVGAKFDPDEMMDEVKQAVTEILRKRGDELRAQTPGQGPATGVPGMQGQPQQQPAPIQSGLM